MYIAQLRELAMCIQRDVQERERALSLECNNVDVDALLYIHNKYIDDKFQTLFYEVLCKTEAIVAEDWPRYPTAWKRALLDHVCEVFARADVLCSRDTGPHIARFANQYERKYQMARERYRTMSCRQV